MSDPAWAKIKLISQVVAFSVPLIGGAMVAYSSLQVVREQITNLSVQIGLVREDVREVKADVRELRAQINATSNHGG